MTTQEQNKAMVRRILHEGDSHGPDILGEVCTTDYKMYFPSNAAPIGVEEEKSVWQSFRDAFPDFEHTIHDLIAEGEYVVSHETARGTHKGEFQGLAPTGEKIEFSAICIWRFVNGKLAEYRVEADMVGLFRQLGMEMKPSEEEAAATL